MHSDITHQTFSEHLQRLLASHRAFTRRYLRRQINAIANCSRRDAPVALFSLSSSKGFDRSFLSTDTRRRRDEKFVDLPSLA
jgi:hypothetical protein